jgi:hypothetical protein
LKKSMADVAGAVLPAGPTAPAAAPADGAFDGLSFLLLLLLLLLSVLVAPPLSLLLLLLLLLWLLTPTFRFWLLVGPS